jgi:hypothetical protein
VKEKEERERELEKVSIYTCAGEELSACERDRVGGLKTSRGLLEFLEFTAQNLLAT